MRHSDLFIKPGDLVQVVLKEEAHINTRVYDDWLAWDNSLAGKIGVALSESKVNSSNMRIFCDGREVWTVKAFLKKV